MGGRHAANGRPSDGEPDPAGAYEALVEQHGSALLRYVLGLTRGDRVEAQAIVKETWYRVSQEPARLTQRVPSVRAWLVVVARGVFEEGHHRRPGAPFGPAYQEDGATTVVRALDSLSRPHREILVDLFYGGTSLQDAAAARGVPVETVKTRLFYAMRALRLVLDQQAP